MIKRLRINVRRIKPIGKSVVYDVIRDKKPIDVPWNIPESDSFPWEEILIQNYNESEIKEKYFSII